MIVMNVNKNRYLGVHKHASVLRVPVGLFKEKKNNQYIFVCSRAFVLFTYLDTHTDRCIRIR